MPGVARSQTWPVYFFRFTREKPDCRTPRAAEPSSSISRALFANEGMVLVHDDGFGRTDRVPLPQLHIAEGATLCGCGRLGLLGLDGEVEFAVIEHLGPEAAINQRANVFDKHPVLVTRYRLRTLLRIDFHFQLPRCVLRILLRRSEFDGGRQQERSCCSDRNPILHATLQEDVNLRFLFPIRRIVDYHLVGTNRSITLVCYTTVSIESKPCAALGKLPAFIYTVEKIMKRRIMRTGKWILVFAGALLSATLQTSVAQEAEKLPYLNPQLSPEQRATDLVRRMTLAEKASQMQNNSAAVPRLKIPAYQWWSEALHGVINEGVTEYPEPIGLAATFDAPGFTLWRRRSALKAASSTCRTRAKATPASWEAWISGRPISISSAIPRWGRGQETYGEDPFLTGRMGVAYVTGLQGDNPKYYLAIATPKHYAVHSGPEPTRHFADVDVSKHDQVDTYEPAFRAAVVEGKAGSVMCAYNAINGEPACANQYLLQDQLRGKWGFQGYVVSDCDAVQRRCRQSSLSSDPGAGRRDLRHPRHGQRVRHLHLAIRRARREGLHRRRSAGISAGKRLSTPH